MIVYFATFISGCQEIIAAKLQRYPHSQVRLAEIHDGLAVFESSLTPGQLSELRFLNNVYRQVTPDALPPIPKSQSVVLRARTGNQPSEIPTKLRQQFISAGYTLTAHRPQHEFLFWRRTNGQALLGQLLSRAGFKKRNQLPGELRPELAHILGLVAVLGVKDVVLDPFAGQGGIVRECLQGFHCAKVIAVEQNPSAVALLQTMPRLTVLNGNAQELNIKAGSVDRVITDPPWGDFDQTQNLHGLYKNSLQEIHRVLRTKGVAVILTSAPWLPGLARDEHFNIEKQYKVLVSGKKATIFKLRKLAA